MLGKIGGANLPGDCPKTSKEIILKKARKRTTRCASDAGCVQWVGRKKAIEKAVMRSGKIEVGPERAGGRLVQKKKKVRGFGLVVGGDLTSSTQEGVFSN